MICRSLLDKMHLYKCASPFKVRLNICFTATCVLVLLHGDGLGYEYLLDRKGSGADITAGTGPLMEVSLPHIKHVPINLCSTGSVWTHRQSSVMNACPQI